MNKAKCIVTITDGISPTSMPFNEFVLYRLKKYPDEKQIIIQLFEKGVDKNVSIPYNVDFYSLGMNPFAIMQTINKIEKKYNVMAYHIHEGKSVILFFLATLFTKRKKTVYTLHSTYKNYPFHNKLFSFTASLLANYIACVSKTSYKYYPNILKKLRGRHVLSVQNGIDTERIQVVEEQYDTFDKPFTLVYVARLVPLKRHYILLNVLHNLPDVRLELIGSGPLKEKLEAEIKNYGLTSQVVLKGLLPRDEVYKILKSSDLYVSTSSYEGLPVGVLEAMGCGMPCLVTNIEQHQEIAERCSSLMTLPPDTDLWVKKIRELMNKQKDDLKVIGIKNKLEVTEHFSLQRMHKNYNKIYNMLS